jgi:hypothetical protein
LTGAGPCSGVRFLPTTLRDREKLFPIPEFAFDGFGGKTRGFSAAVWCK